LATVFGAVFAPQFQQRLPHIEHVRGVAANDLFLILAQQAGQLGMHVFLRLESDGLWL
jgi:hypothetical protein